MVSLLSMHMQQHFSHFGVIVIIQFILSLKTLNRFMYVSSVVGALGGMSGPVNRAILSKTIPKEDIGKICYWA